jgi:hypothetical protein
MSVLSEQLWQQTLLEEAADLILCALSSVPREKIDPKQYWPWAQKALKLAGDAGTTYERLVSILHRELQLGDQPFTQKASNRIYSIGEAIKSRNDYAKFRRLLRDQAPYIIVLARVRKDAMKTKPAADADWIDLENF